MHFKACETKNDILTLNHTVELLHNGHLRDRKVAIFRGVTVLLSTTAYLSIYKSNRS